MTESIKQRRDRLAERCSGERWRYPCDKYYRSEMKLGYEEGFNAGLQDEVVKVMCAALRLALLDAIKCTEANQYVMSEWGIEPVRKALEAYERAVKEIAE